jgi:hypothetical protein
MQAATGQLLLNPTSCITQIRSVSWFSCHHKSVNQKFKDILAYMCSQLYNFSTYKLGQLVKVHKVDFKTLPSTVTHIIFQQETVKRNPEILKSTPPSSRLYSDYPCLPPMINSHLYSYIQRDSSHLSCWKTCKKQTRQNKLALVKYSLVD